MSTTEYTMPSEPTGCQRAEGEGGKPSSPGLWSYRAAQGMGFSYHWIDGLLGKPVLIECTKSEAMLIASAPDLLAFAEWISDTWHSKEGMKHPALIAQKAMQVLEKARGAA